MADSATAFSPSSTTVPPLATRPNDTQLGEIELITKPNPVTHVESPEHGPGLADDGRSPLLDGTQPSAATETTININLNVSLSRPSCPWRRKACKVGAFTVLGVVVVAAVLASLPKDNQVQSARTHKKTTIMLSFGEWFVCVRSSAVELTTNRCRTDVQTGFVTTT